MKVQIAVRNRRYTVRSDESGIDLQAVANYVNAKMDEVAGKTATLDEYTIAMLAALNIASEFERFRQQVNQTLTELDREVASTAVLLEAALPKTADGEEP